LTLATLPCAALLATTPGVLRTRVTAAVLGVMSAALLVAPGGGRLDAVTRAFTVLLTVAFVAAVPLSPRGPTSFLRPALRAIWLAGAATAVLVQVMWGADAWGALAWEARRSIGLTMRFLVELQPAFMGLYEPIVRFVSLATPLTLALKAVVGLALAWRWRRWLTTADVSQDPGNVAIHEALVTSTH
jgi:hypothetical protein